MAKTTGDLFYLPILPEPLARLGSLAYNVRWAWNDDTRELFRRLDPDLWESIGENPVLQLQTINPARLTDAAQDADYLAHLERVLREFDDYMDGWPRSGSTWYSRAHPGMAAYSGDGSPIAYFSAEFGLTETLPIYAGGLGVLAGDHLKSASDLGVPLVAVGLLYQYGYFRQQIDPDGWQQEQYEPLDEATLPMTLERTSNGKPLLVEVPFPDRPVYAQVWRVQVGRVSLYLLDTDIRANESQDDRFITGHLYGGNKDTRIRHEIVLGIGGYRALEALGIQPTVYHMNEGHAAFLSLERIKRLMETRGISFDEAMEVVRESQVFTTHTPVDAGHDYFSLDLMDRYLSGYVNPLGIDPRRFLGLGRRQIDNDGELFCMTVLALHTADRANGVSELHGEVSRRQWQELWPATPEVQVPIEHITNGVHLNTWVAPAMGAVYDTHLTVGPHGPAWRTDPADEPLWQGAANIPNRELWSAHEAERAELIEFVRRRVRTQLERHGAPAEEIGASAGLLHPDALTIGFARRFATYKRATLLFSDQERLARILNDPERPVQIVFAGKAHPHDNAGKELIKEIFALSRREPFRGKVVFVEGYDIGVARHLVQGVDVWLNNPYRPLEASGTSGMKAAANGVLNLSTLDGWWNEAWENIKSGSAPAGWAIGSAETHADLSVGYHTDSDSLYDLLETEVVPLFYTRDADGLPAGWIERMKNSILTLAPVYNTDRMVREYTDRFYLRAAVGTGPVGSDGPRG